MSDSLNRPRPDVNRIKGSAGERVAPVLARASRGKGPVSLGALMPGAARGATQPRASAPATMAFTTAAPWKRPFSMKTRLPSVPETIAPAR